MSSGKNRGWGSSPTKAAKWALKRRYENGEIGDKTRQSYIRAFAKFSRYMREKHEIDDVVQYTEEHLDSYAKSVAAMYQAAYAQKLVSAINSVMKTITYGSWESVPPASSTQTRRRNVRETPHIYIAPEKTLELLREHLQPEVLAVIGLIILLGLRLEEAVSLDIVAALKEHHATGNIDVIYGTKGGRGRDVPRLVPSSKLVHEWLCHCRKIAGPKFSLIPDGKTRDEFMRLVRHEALQILKEKFQLTIHQLRHEYAARRYREITGHYSPVYCRVYGLPLAEKTLDQHARSIITLELGHGRVQVVSVYIGSYRGSRK